MHASAFPAALALAMAAATAQAAPAAADQGRLYDIPAGTLDQVLNRYAQDAGVLLTIDGELTAGRSSPGLRGRYGVHAGFAAILAGNGLTAAPEGPGYVLRRAPAAGETTTLEPVSVSGSHPSDETTFVAETTRAGTKTDTAILDVPQSISVVTRKQMEAQNAQSVTEVLRYVPGVTVETYGVDPKGFDWVMIRGFNAQATSDYRDGLRQGASGYTFFRTDPYALERVEVLRGPSSVLYGQGDAGGVINRVSKLPQAAPQQEVELQYGTYQRKQAAVDLTGPANESGTLMYRLIGVARDANTQFTYPNGDRIGDDRLYAAPSITWAPSADTRFTLMAEYLRDRSGGTIGTVTLDGKPTKLRNGDPDFNRFDQDQKSIGYQFEHRFNDTFQVRQNLRYGQIDSILDNLLLSGISSAGITRAARRFDESMNNLALDNQLQAGFSTGAVKHTVLAGLDYNRVHADAQRYTGPAPALNPYNPVYGVDVPTPTTPMYDALERTYQTGLYLQDQIRIAGRWMLTLGGRYDWYEQKLENRLAQEDTDQKGERFSGRAGLSYQFDNGVAPYVSYSQSFLPNAGATVSGGTFAPSRGRQWEGGIKYQPPGSNALYTVAVFDIRKTNVLTNDLTNPGFYTAAGEVKSRGVELESKFSLGAGWDVTGSYTFVDAEVTKANDGSKGKRPALVPEHSASGWVNYTFRDGLLAGLSAGAGIRYVGGTYGDNLNTLRIGSHTLVDAGLSYTYDKHLTFSVNATNLFDKDYLATCPDLTDCYPGNRRTVIGRVRYRF